MSSIFGLWSSYMLEYHWLFALLLRSARRFTDAQGKWTLLPPISPPSSSPRVLFWNGKDFNSLWQSTIYVLFDITCYLWLIITNTSELINDNENFTWIWLCLMIAFAECWNINISLYCIWFLKLLETHYSFWNMSTAVAVR